MFHPSDDRLQEYMDMLRNLLKFDRFELKSSLMLFSIKVSEMEDSERMRNILRKVLLEELLKTNISNRNHYVTCLK